ncbi:MULTISPECIES: RNA polymerase factor sigma-54 [Emticicia]|uniref:RNA polymerase factor sigma-54 n=1 Tax=Emticicia TaxID=312278 RepID=UPI0020A0CE53|nr:MULTISPECIES: RNA polymerase factor sigma-54 [Emticicia]UTA68181.1 RNA polymerase factor sigma-54 [Emticicia sp. 21SJ11W-3]
MQKLSLNQSLQQRLSPQQIQFIKLLQIPTAELDQRIEEELEVNPALEEGLDMDDRVKDEYEDDYSDDYDEYNEYETYEGLDVKQYLDQDDYAGYKMYGDGWGEEDKDVMPIVATSTLAESLIQQLGYLKLDERQEAIGQQLIGSIEEDGYIRRPLRSISNDMAFTQNIYTNEEELAEILKKIQTFEPSGIGARDLRECLLLQLERKNHEDFEVQVAIRIITDFFDEFTKKHYEKIQRRLDIDDEVLKDAIRVITRLNPKPGNTGNGDSTAAYLLADFIVTNNNGKLDVILNSKNAPELRVSRSFADMLDTYDKTDKNGSAQHKSIKETVTFVKQKLDAAKWFIDAIKQRQQTLLKTMKAIVDYQYDFFLEGDESKLRPMILKDIAIRIDMDISTVSRVANSKAVQTDFGIYPLKYFFSEGISTDSGEDASSREVKNILKDLIDNEPKNAPLSDDKLEKILNKRGYNIARRTVAKYREQLNIPVARLRKQL